MLRSRFLACLATSAAVLLTGCGGNGSIDSGPIAGTNTANNAVNNGPNSGDVGLFVTDGLSDKYDHVWVSFKKIELKLAAGGTREIFEDPQGLAVDLASLHDESGPRYQFLNQITLPAGTYTGADITLDKAAVVFPLNATTGRAEEFDKQAAGSKDAVLSVAFDPPKMLGTGHDDLVFDFDLSQWKENDGRLEGVVTSSMGAGLEAAERNGAVVEKGEVNALKGDVPQQTFTLKSGKASDIEVQTTAGTALIGTGSPVLAKGASVQVSGTFDTNTRRFLATSIKILDPKAPAQSEIEGRVSSIDAKAGTLNLTPRLARGALPQGIAVAVAFSPDARFSSASGLSMTSQDFFKGLSAEKSVSIIADGSYDSGKNLFTAANARLETQDSQPKVKVAGLVSNPKSEAQTFGLTVTDYEGLMTKPGAAEVVSVTPQTTFTDPSGKSLTAPQFFSALATPSTAQVDGLVDTGSGNVVATSVKLAPAPATPAKPKRARA